MKRLRKMLWGGAFGLPIQETGSDTRLVVGRWRRCVPRVRRSAEHERSQAPRRAEREKLDMIDEIMRQAG